MHREIRTHQQAMEWLSEQEYSWFGAFAAEDHLQEMSIVVTLVQSLMQQGYLNANLLTSYQKGQTIKWELFTSQRLDELYAELSQQRDFPEVAWSSAITYTEVLIKRLLWLFDSANLEVGYAFVDPEILFDALEAWIQTALD